MANNHIENDNVSSKGLSAANGASQAFAEEVYGRPHSVTSSSDQHGILSPPAQRYDADRTAQEVIDLGRDAFMKLSGGDGILTEADIKNFLHSDSQQYPIPDGATHAMQDLLHTIDRLDERTLSDKIKGVLPEVTFDGLFKHAKDIRPTTSGSKGD